MNTNTDEITHFFMIWREKAMMLRLLRFVNQSVDCFVNNEKVVSSSLTGAPFNRTCDPSLCFLLHQI